MFLEPGIAYDLNRVLSDLRRRRDGSGGEAGAGLTPTETVERFSSHFRSRFGPEALASLDGEALLRRLHGRDDGDESLVAYLESRADNTFDTRVFGAIDGGSAFHFDLFWSRSRGAWMTGARSTPRTVGVDEAIRQAAAQRDELAAAARVLDAFPQGDAANDAAYRQMQADLDRAAPSVSRTAWGHKYLCILRPDALDPFHLTEIQRGHLIKLLLRPEESEDGRVRASGVDARYANAALFAEVARALGGLPLTHLAAVLNARHGRRPRPYWRLQMRGTAGGGIAPGQWETMLQDGCLALGAGYDKPLSELRAGDIVVAIDGAEALGIGCVRRGGMGLLSGETFPYRVEVDWRSLEFWTLPYPEPRATASRQTASALRPLPTHGRFVDNLLEIERHLLWDAAPFLPAEPPPTGSSVRETSFAVAHAGNGAASLPPPPSAATLVAETKSPFYTASPPPEPPHRVREEPSPLPAEPPPPLTGIAARIADVLARKKQAILYGPPGTGKTFWAEATARELAARSWFGRAADDLTPSQASSLAASGGAVRTCCFHPAYGYEDFLEGYRPDAAMSETGAGLRFERRDGIFKRLCRDAADDPDRDFFLVIDEINRGDVPRIFGDLLTLLEASRRGKSGVLLPLSGDTFTVPPNVYLIGTMNTADRSVALLDAALRRRFGFIEMPPDPSALADAVFEGVSLADWLGALNRRIAARLGRDGTGRHRQIGHAYFLDAATGAPISDLAGLAAVLRDEVLPLLDEYCDDEPDLLPALLGDAFLDGRTGRIRDDLFLPGHEATLLDALRAGIDAVPDDGP